LKFIVISDTHGHHKKLILPEGDIIIHAGDISMRGEEHEVADFIRWFAKLDYRYKIFIAGNHDFFFERVTKEKIQSLIPDNVIYLHNSSIELEGIVIWGSPITPWFHNWAFNVHRGADIALYWSHIPCAADIVITHGPSYGCVDRTIYGSM
jgi:Calcineurin-like phosphoesterase.